MRYGGQVVPKKGRRTKISEPPGQGIMLEDLITTNGVTATNPSSIKLQKALKRDENKINDKETSSDNIPYEGSSKIVLKAGNERKKEIS